MSKQHTRKPTSYDVINVLKDLYEAHGDELYMVEGRVQLYSGPLYFIKKALRAIANHDKAFDQAGSIPSLIDQCMIGQKLDSYQNGLDIYAYFKSIYPEDKEKAFRNADKVMRFASREFVKRASGHIETHVCGADLENVFYEVELPELIRNDKIETINGIPMQRIRDIYLTQGAYIAYREVCKGELGLSQTRAKRECTATAKKDHKERLSCFQINNVHNFGLLRFKRARTITRHGPHLPRTVRDKPLRTITPKAPYQALSVQYG
ncbi:MAG: hypothetical protein AB7S81_01175 [Bdellovibrionales bacterium]